MEIEYFNNSANLSLISELYFSGVELVLPEIYTLSTFRPTLNNNATIEEKWELCSDLDFTGDCVCMNFTRKSLKMVTFNPKISLMSVKHGCSNTTRIYTLSSSCSFVFGWKNEKVLFIVFGILIIFYV
jgi:hypothetical protein